MRQTRDSKKFNKQVENVTDSQVNNNLKAKVTKQTNVYKLDNTEGKKMIYFKILPTLISFFLINTNLFVGMKEELKGVPMCKKNFKERLQAKKWLNFDIYFNKIPHTKNHRDYYEIKFGSDNIKSDYLNMSGDTIFILDTNYVQKGCKNRQYFMLNSCALNKDTVFIGEFGLIAWQKTWLSDVYFDKVLNDSIYTFSFKFSRGVTRCFDLLINHSDYITDVNYLKISKQYGFVEISYIKHSYNICYKFR